MASRYRQIHNIWSVCVGPSPATGYHYSDYNNVGHNNSQLTLFDNNLVLPLDRINNFQYRLDISRENITQLGTRGLVDRKIVNRPQVQLNFGYWIAGVRNESRLGFVVNYPDPTGALFLSQETCCISNFTGRNTDYRNIFVAVSPIEMDVNSNVSNQFSAQSNRNDPLSPSGLLVFAFGDCYLTSYSINASVGQIPQATVSYVGDNIMVYNSGSGVNIPAVDPKSGNLINNINFTIPRTDSFKSPAILRPSDITLHIQENNIDSPSGLLGISSMGMSIQSLDVKMNLDREDLRSIGYILPIDRRVNFPVLVDVSISNTIDNNISGNLSQILKDNKTYDLLVNMYNPACPNTSGNPIGMQLKIHNAKYVSTAYRYGLNNNLIGDFSFTAEIDVNNAAKGFFISGQWNTPPGDFPFNFVVSQSNFTGFVFTPDNYLIIVNSNTV
jgi:hypothetical protein